MGVSSSVVTVHFLMFVTVTSTSSELSIPNCTVKVVGTKAPLSPAFWFRAQTLLLQ